jgi:excisionase family DNA binding protein
MENIVQLYDVKRVAQQLSVSPWTVRAYIRAGKLRHVRIGRLVRLDEKEIADFVASSKRVGDSSTTKNKKKGTNDDER